ncbi:bifunctional deaminase-reductase domain protein [Xylanimonas cellulosilytica DSM 15894]|uniref:Bifunctional deaminase-reductase domain protein n=1 Tax=Xylanimonas cellulosilytica (strain DSM 15894 / JCM 12276 / CECT 5975 / KCTC 9989 / LMG 20990 / NBRC 107835 / XIL07) TaxID=446471 RepID=D1BY91_XYLCX|nr:dihydrofolate reductase family protein [Xylanimonas cellulosilytica]ACZ29934.1 bifunctional deaminase-reductase domain protein [Xylanimonas cellulosilytica DSM 15894]
MGTITVYEAITLDGVMQAPGRADEDTRGGFVHGGWAVGYDDDVLARFAGAAMAASTGLLLGGRTYVDLLRHWTAVEEPNPYTDALVGAPKHVVSRDGSTSLRYPNSTLHVGDAHSTVRRLKDAWEGTLTVLGSGELVSSLDAVGLVDEYVLLIYPILLGSGHRLFADEHRKGLHLVEAVPTTTGVLACRYAVGLPEVRD